MSTDTDCQQLHAIPPTTAECHTGDWVAVVIQSSILPTQLLGRIEAMMMKITRLPFFPAPPSRATDEERPGPSCSGRAWKSSSCDSCPCCWHRPLPPPHPRQLTNHLTWQRHNLIRHGAEKEKKKSPLGLWLYSLGIRFIGRNFYVQIVSCIPSTQQRVATLGLCTGLREGILPLSSLNNFHSSSLFCTFIPLVFVHFRIPLMYPLLLVSDALSPLPSWVSTKKPFPN